jgi:hypothetical protein
MKLRARLLRAVSNDCGPARKSVLRGIAKAHGYAAAFDATFRAMLKTGELVMYGELKGATYGLPGRHKKR